MVKLVLLHKANSIYDDVPDVRYDFPRIYLETVLSAVGDEVVYYEPVKAGAKGYFATARIADVINSPHAAERYWALIEPGSYIDFVQNVPRIEAGEVFESRLRAKDGTPLVGGIVQSAVRAIPDADFERIARIGLPQDLEAQEAARYSAQTQSTAFREPVAPFDRPVIERLSRRPYREAAFRSRVREAYDYRCALSGLQLRNGGGRPEVQAAHIRPVEQRGSDAVHNGIALSGTLHWMFDRGLVSVTDELEILVSGNKVPEAVVQRLIVPERRLYPPKDPRDRPHPDNLRWHRENIFGQVLLDGPTPWG